MILEHRHAFWRGGGDESPRAWTGGNMASYLAVKLLLTVAIFNHVSYLQEG